jgi:hypothetical protein
MGQTHTHPTFLNILTFTDPDMASLSRTLSGPEIAILIRAAANEEDEEDRDDPSTNLQTLLEYCDNVGIEASELTELGDHGKFDCVIAYDDGE